MVAGRRRAKARDEARHQKQIIHTLVASALAEGMTKKEIAELAQISRPTLDAMLKEKP